MEINDADRAWGKAIPDYIKNEDEKLPPVGRFNFGQKLFFWGIFYSVILLLLSGVALWYTETLPWSLRVRALRRRSDSRQRRAHHHWAVSDSRVHERGPRRG